MPSINAGARVAPITNEGATAIVRATRNRYWPDEGGDRF
jgi:hypothetical protein